MTLKELMSEFMALGYATVGAGSKHPVMPAPELQSHIDEFLAENPSLKKDQSYVEFLEVYSGAAVDYPDFQLTVLIYGFSDVSVTFLDPQILFVKPEGFIQFAEI